MQPLHRVSSLVYILALMLSGGLLASHSASAAMIETAAPPIGTTLIFNMSSAPPGVLYAALGAPFSLTIDPAVQTSETQTLWNGPKWQSASLYSYPWFLWPTTVQVTQGPGQRPDYVTAFNISKDGKTISSPSLTLSQLSNNIRTSNIGHFRIAATDPAPNAKILPNVDYYDIAVVALPAGTPIITGVMGLYTYTVGDTLKLTAVSNPNGATFTWSKVSDSTGDTPSEIFTHYTTPAQYQTLYTIQPTHPKFISNGTTLTIPNVTQANSGVYAVTATLGKLSHTFPVEIHVMPKPTSHLTAANLAVLVNDNDPDSVTISQYYQLKRHIPAANMIHLKIPVKGMITPEEFAPIKAQIDAAMTPNIQAIAVAWKFPYKVGSHMHINSITSAISLGYMPSVTTSSFLSNINYPSSNIIMINSTGPALNPFYFNPLFNSNSNTPYTSFGFRPSMMLAGFTVADTIAMIDHGVASDGTHPTGSYYALKTQEFEGRDLRGAVLTSDPSYPIGLRDSKYITTRVIPVNGLKNAPDVMMYHTGTKGYVDHIASNHYLPGAIADNLTSNSAFFEVTHQISSLDFIAAGATGTYGTVWDVGEFGAMYPNGQVFLRHYSAGDTLIEAYWKSIEVNIGGQYIGEPLASPYYP